MIAPTNTGISIGRLLRISRPRFWIYVLGPMLLYFAGNGSFLSLYQNITTYGITPHISDIVGFILLLGYFTLPANLWIYGWNDLADGDTDKFNTKKGDYEEKMSDNYSLQKKLKYTIWGWNIGYVIVGATVVSIVSYFQTIKLGIPGRPGIYVMIGVLTIISLLYLIPFFISAYLYSCKPLRAKAKPFIDGIMNILYIATPITLALLPLEPTNIPNIPHILYASIAGLFRCMAMHCYSAIPDITPDAQAGLNTTAVYLGKQKALIYCGILYALAALLSYSILGVGSIIGGIIYLTMIIVSYRKQDIFGLYKIFPYINFAVGFGLFWWILLK